VGLFVDKTRSSLVVESYSARVWFSLAFTERPEGGRRTGQVMQFEPSSVQLSATITELIEQLRQAAYDEGYEDASSIEPDQTDTQVTSLQPSTC